MPAATSSVAEAAPPTCRGRAATLLGTPGADHLVGTDGPDVIVARGGEDVVVAGAGDDLVCGGAGADTLRGGAGDDRLHGQRDRLVSDRGGTRFEPDLLAGGPGDDLLDVGDDRRADVEGAHGILSFAAARRGVTVDLGGAERRGTATGQGTDTIVVVPPPACDYFCFGLAVRGSRHDDRLRGSADPDHFIGRAGDDHLDGRGGADELRAEGEIRPGPRYRADDDTVSGGGGADRLIGQVGRDGLYGDDGDDTVWSLGGGPSEVFGGRGDDELVVWFSASPVFMLDGGEGTDFGQIDGPRRPGAGGRPTAATVRMSEGTVTAGGELAGRLGGVEDLLLGSGIRWTYYGTDASETVRGTLTAPFRAWTYGGDDEVHGTDGADRIDVGAGTDRVFANGGRDTCLGAEVARSCEVTTP